MNTTTEIRTRIREINSELERLNAFGRPTNAQADKAEALEVQGTELQGWRLGELLVHLGFVDRAVVESFVTEQVRDQIADLLSWPVAEKKFRNGKRTRQDVAPPSRVVDLLAAASVQVVHCPTSNAKLGSGLCPVPDLLAAGINVCLGTDGAASNNSLDIFGEARIASLLAKLIRTDAAALPARTALEMATSRGARALGMADRIGSLQPGMAADFIAVDFSGPGMQPLYDPVAQLIHTSSGNRVSHVWVDGECLLKDYVLTRMDTASILATANHWRQRIQDS